MGSISEPEKGSNYDEIFMHHSLQFAESLKELKVLKKQLYSAAEYFESSYYTDDHQILVMESSKDYLAKALVNTVDHLGSVADKLNKFLDEKAHDFNSTNTKFSRIEQKLGSFKGFVDTRGLSHHSLTLEAPRHKKHYILPQTGVDSFEIRKPELFYRNSPTPKYDMNPAKQDNPFAKAFQAARVKPQPPSSRKGVHSATYQNPTNFSFMRVMSNKDTGKRSVSPVAFTLKRSGSVANRSMSPSSYDTKQRSPSVPRRAMSVQRISEGQVVESYAKRSKHLFKALLNAHRSRKEIH